MSLPITNLLLSLLTATLFLHHHRIAGTSSPTGFSIPLIYRDSFHSPLYPGNLTTLSRHIRLLRYSRSRLLWLNSSIHGTPLDVSIRPIVQKERWLYMVQLAIGSPPKPLHLVLDTGSRLAWTQCHPCNPCFPQDEPHYSHKNSRTFVHIPCNHPLCWPECDCLDHRCVYHIKYADKSFTLGYLAKDTFTFQSKNGGPEAVEGVTFGCSYANSRNMFGSRKIGGVMGMGGGPTSFAVQLARRTGGRFSYCFVPMEAPAFSYLRFGSDIVMNGNVRSTPFLRTNFPIHYHLNLIDLSFEGRRMNLPPGTFRRLPNRIGGCVIDTGTPYTHVIKPAYQALRRLMVDHFEYFDLHPIDGSRYGYGMDLCYLMPDDFEGFPTVTLHFQGGADLQLSGKRLFVVVEERNFFCSGLLPNDVVTIFGSMQQTNVRFTYDIGRQQLLFTEEKCDHA